MQRDEFRLGEDFWCGGNRWRCTDIGARTIVAICLDRVEVAGSSARSSRRLGIAGAENEGWFNGPPYAVPEHVFDEAAIVDCSTVDDEPIVVVLPSSKEAIQLSPKTTARVWSAVRRGEAKDAEEYGMRLINRALASDGMTSQPLRPNLRQTKRILSLRPMEVTFDDFPFRSIN